MSEVQRLFSDRKEVSLPNVAPWNTLPVEAIATLLVGSTSVRLVGGGAVDSDHCIVVSGALGVERELLDGRRILCALYYEGDLINLRRRERLRQGWLIALRSSELLLLGSAESEECMAKHAALARLMSFQLEHQLARLRDHTVDLACKTPLERIASVLFEFRRWPENKGPAEGQCIVRLPIRKYDVAAYIGITPETFSRALRQLEREGLIQLQASDRILLTDAPSMRRIANGGRPRQSTRTAS